MELEKAYEAKKYEDEIFRTWEKSGLFSPKMQKGKRPFTIMMPPPNATGTLHLGHAVMLALQDILIRYHRMKGEPTLWLPGTDHASIATQNKVEKLLAEEGLTRHDLGREKFLQRIDEFVKNSQKTIRNQVRKMGSSCDWTRERYTLEPHLSRAVREMFARMYKDGLIYRGHRIVNWCPRCASTLADDEVEYKEEKTKFYYFRYGPFVIGTARPETKFQDKIIVVHPDDKRYRRFIGTEMTVPWIEGEVKAGILADKSVDMSFGTGAMTITPAHDFNDFEIAKRHNLEIVPIIDEQGNLTDKAGSFAGMNAREAREKIVEKLAEKNLVDKIEEHYVHNISLCYRCDTPIEPLVSRQWFIAVDKPFGRKKKSLKEMAIAAVRKKEIRIVPDRFEKTYFHWMENLRDWCISRQIWFGHQIPVWYCIGDEVEGGACKIECKAPIVQTDPPKACPHCGSKHLRRDPDTLDTWFSAGMWTFSTLGWPDATDNFKYFHPTSVLETGYDILFFWVARMIIMTEYALNDIPFDTVYLHGLVRTRDGKKMSKSHPETCIDPLDMIAKYGADALRLSMIIGATPGNDVRLYEEKIAGYRNFVNKIWNAARFALMQSSPSSGAAAQESQKHLEAKTIADKWILTRAQELVEAVTRDLDAFRFSDAGMKIYDFTWNEYCAWYLEIAKGSRQNTAVLHYVLETILKLLHPFVPFVTEALWKHLGKGTMLLTESWPKPEKRLKFPKDAEKMDILVEVVTAIRAMRQENRIDAAKKIPAVLVSKKWRVLLLEKEEPIKRLARLSVLDILEKKPDAHDRHLSQSTDSGIDKCFSPELRKTSLMPKSQN
ncbi:valine--tRNA ligase [Candidatus Peregrinibacteria bacterium]|nr:valine--tRNA ligase [Candidatus Peregrinibacteria bacterium]